MGWGGVEVYGIYYLIASRIPPGLGRFFLEVWFSKNRPQCVPKIRKETEALKRRTIFTFKGLSVQWFFYVTEVGDGLEEMRELWMEMYKIRVWNSVVTLF